MNESVRVWFHTLSTISSRNREQFVKVLFLAKPHFRFRTHSPCFRLDYSRTRFTLCPFNNWIFTWYNESLPYSVLFQFYWRLHFLTEKPGLLPGICLVADSLPGWSRVFLSTECLFFILPGVNNSVSAWHATSSMLVQPTQHGWLFNSPHSPRAPLREICNNNKKKKKTVATIKSEMR